MSSVDLQRGPRLSRRTLALGAAWATPAIALGATAPTAAASNVASCVNGKTTLQWADAVTNISVSSQAPDEVQGATPHAADGRLINRDTITATPIDLISCATPGPLTLTVDTTRYGNAFDSYTCVPGWDYRAQDPTSNCAAAQPTTGPLGNGLSGVPTGYMYPSVFNTADPAWSQSWTVGGVPLGRVWKDGANLMPQDGSPDGTPSIAGTRYGLALGWNDLSTGSGVTGGYSNRTEWTFTFNRPVTNLSFNLFDFDYNNPTSSGNREVAYITPGPTSYGTAGANVGGQGTQAQPWRAVNSGNLTAHDASGGVTGITYASVTTFTIVAYSSDTAHRSPENLFLSDLAFDCPTGCT